MKAKELMIGDWIYNTAKEKNVKVMGVRVEHDEAFVLTDHGDVWWSIEGVSPIELTGEILERNGFEKIHDGEVLKKYRLLMGEFDENFNAEDKIQVAIAKKRQFYHIEVSRDFLSAYAAYCFRRNVFVHTLQHIIQMCGLKKEIVL